MINLKGKWITFKLIGHKPKTKVYNVIANKGKHMLGIVQWYAGWRRYCFIPTKYSVYEPVCLLDIIKFLNDLMEERRVTKEKQ